MYRRLTKGWVFVDSDRTQAIFHPPVPRPSPRTGARHLGSRGQDQLQGQHLLCVPALPVVSAPCLAKPAGTRDSAGGSSCAVMYSSRGKGTPCRCRPSPAAHVHPAPGVPPGCLAPTPIRKSHPPTHPSSLPPAPHWQRVSGPGGTGSHGRPGAADARGELAAAERRPAGAALQVRLAMASWLLKAASALRCQHASRAAALRILMHLRCPGQLPRTDRLAGVGCGCDRCAAMSWWTRCGGR